MDEYLFRFEELKSLLVIPHPTLDESYFVSSFISRLSNELRPTIKMMQPATIKQAAEKAKL